MKQFTKKIILLSFFSFVFVTSAYAAPDTKISFTFDDAWLSQYQYAGPILRNANQRATLYVPTGLIGTTGYMSWNQTLELMNDGWDISAHTVTHAELETLTEEAMSQEVSQSNTDLLNQGMNGNNFASPYGSYTVATIAEIAKYFNSHRTFHTIGFNGWPYNKYLLSVKPVTNLTTVAEIEGWIDEAILNKTWLIIVFHEILPTVDPLDTYSWSTANLESLMTVIDQKNITLETVEDVLEIQNNLIQNNSFENGLLNWSTDNPSQVSIDTNQNGSYPFSTNSAKVTGSSATTHLFSNIFPVQFNDLYGIRFFVNTESLTSGELGFYIDEYNSIGDWISGKWLGQAGLQFVIDESYRYTPSSDLVKKASLQIYLGSNSVGHAFIDSVEFVPAVSTPIDTEAPVITLVGSENITIEVLSTYNELGANATDIIDGPVAVTISGTADVNTIGTYQIEYKATDSQGNTSTKIRSVTVSDSTKPIITINGSNPQIIELQSSYLELGGNVTDNFDQNVQIVIDSSSVNTSQIGEYIVTYNATDSSNNIADQITRTVKIVDTEQPIISVIGQNIVSVNVGTQYIDEGATAYDSNDGDITSKITTFNNVDSNTIGSYIIRYNVTDINGNNAIEQTRTVNVVDVVKPIISLIGNSLVSISVNEVYSEEGATATDNYDGVISSSIVIDQSALVNSTPGVYTILYNVTDSSGNIADTVVRTVTVVAPTQPTPTPIVRSSSRGGGGRSLIPGFNIQQVPTQTISTIGNNIGVGEVLGQSTSSTFMFMKNLSLGSRGNDVVELQKRLTAEKMYAGPITGYFGSLTLNSVKIYQAKNSLPTTGYVGRLTRTVLNGGIIEPAVYQTVPKSTSQLPTGASTQESSNSTSTTTQKKTVSTFLKNLFKR